MVFLRLFHLHLSPQLMLLLFIILYFFFRCWFSCWRHFIAFLHQDVKELQVIYTVHVPMKGYPQYVILVYQHCTYVLNGSLHSDQIYPNEEQNHLVNETHEYEYPSNLRIHCRRLMMVDVYIYICLELRACLKPCSCCPCRECWNKTPQMASHCLLASWSELASHIARTKRTRRRNLEKGGPNQYKLSFPSFI